MRPENLHNGAGRERDLDALIPTLLKGECRTVDALTESRYPLNGGGENVRICGDVGPGGAVRNAAALVVDGQLDGTESRPCRLECEGVVVVRGSARFAQVLAREIYVEKGARSCVLTAESQVYAGGDLIGVDVQVGDGDRRLRRVDGLRYAIASDREKGEELALRLLQEKRRLDGILAATGIVFNLNIGQIVRQEADGLHIDLAPFYAALPNRSEENIDRALKEFFARAVLGLLTRMNKAYISSGPGHRKRFTSVVQRLQTLVMLTRAHDKCDRSARTRRDQLQLEISRSETASPTVGVRGVVMPESNICVSVLQVATGESGEIEATARRDGLTLRKGKGRNRDEVVLWRDGEVLDMIFIVPDSLRQVVFGLRDGRIAWSDLAVGAW